MSDFQEQFDKLSSTIVDNNKALSNTINRNHLEQTEKIGDVQTSVAVLSSKFEAQTKKTEEKLEDVDDRFTRDYKRINDLEKNIAIESEIKKHEKEQTTESRNRGRYFLYVVSAIIGIMLAVNSLWGIIDKVNENEGERVRIERMKRVEQMK
jgi:hypothetical protein